MKRRMLGILIAAAAIVGLTTGQAAAITDGELDGNGHPYVGLMVAQDADGNPLWRCSGTLLSSKLFLTAGHCTESPAAHVEIWFAADVESGIPANGYPFDGDVGGRPLHPPAVQPERVLPVRPRRRRAGQAHEDVEVRQAAGAELTRRTAAGVKNHLHSGRVRAAEELPRRRLVEEQRPAHPYGRASAPDPDQRWSGWGLLHARCRTTPTPAGRASATRAVPTSSARPTSSAA